MLRTSASSPVPIVALVGVVSAVGGGESFTVTLDDDCVAVFPLSPGQDSVATPLAVGTMLSVPEAALEPAQIPEAVHGVAPATIFVPLHVTATEPPLVTCSGLAEIWSVGSDGGGGCLAATLNTIV